MILHKTILRDLCRNMAVILFSMSIIMFMEKFVRITRLFMGKGADLADIAKIFIYLQPSILMLSLPIAILISIFLTYGRMSTDSEVIVMKASGMSFWDIARAAVTLSVVCLILLLGISLYVMPRGMHAFKKTLHETIVKKASLTLEAESFSDVFKGTMIYVKEIPSPNEFRGIYVFREGIRNLDQPVVIVAEKGAISSLPEQGIIKLSMENGLIHTYDKKSSSEMSFREYDFILTSGIETEEKTRPEEIRTGILWEGRGKKSAWDVELYRRFALPFSCLIFGLLGPALSNRVGRIGRLGGFTLSLAVLILYYMCIVLGEGLAKSGKISPMSGALAPDLIFLAVTFFFVYLAQKDRPLRRL